MDDIKINLKYFQSENINAYLQKQYGDFITIQDYTEEQINKLLFFIMTHIQTGTITNYQLALDIFLLEYCKANIVHFDGEVLLIQTLFNTFIDVYFTKKDKLEVLERLLNITKKITNETIINNIYYLIINYYCETSLFQKNFSIIYYALQNINLDKINTNDLFYYIIQFILYL